MSSNSQPNDFNVTSTDVTAVQDNTSLIVNAIVLGTISLVGTPANVLSFLTLVYEKSLRTPANMPLLFLAVVDGLMCGLVAPLYFTQTFLYGWSVGETLCRIIAFFFLVNGISSVGLIVVVSVCRVITVVYTNAVLKYDHSVTTSAVVVLWSVAMASSYVIVPATEDMDCVNRLYVVPTVVDTVIEMIAVTSGILCLLVIVICYCKIYWKVRRHTRTSNRQNNVVRMRADVVTLRAAILILTSFVLCYGPGIVGMIWNKASRPLREIILLREVSITTSLAGSMFNPFIYVVSSPSFRKGLKRTCRRIFCCVSIRRN
ncbi:RHO [Branchiostoma lanceolatum]|uniref:RHO protein n=1 Tax=Branchiostoma lanceolatum TaxID=7740 RepID=A0A8K0EEW5_BRALA|nr:RHO [Branchiostoma lanceolatum]